MNEASQTSAKEQFDARLKRINDAISLKVPDRVPVTSSHMLYYMTRQKGISNAEAMVNHEKRLAAWRDVTIELNFDMAIHPIVLPPAQPFNALKVAQFKWPGQHLDDDASFQFVENEYLKDDEYDELLADPGDFTVRKLWPRIARTMSPMGALPPLHWFSNSRNLAYMLAPLLGMGPFVSMFKKLMKAGEEALAFSMQMFAYISEMEQLGFPVVVGSAADAPYDYLADQLRGMKGSMLDMFRRPEKILETTDLFTEMGLEYAKFLAQSSNNPRVWMPLHRGADGFMSEDQFEKFYWPSLKKLILALIDAGLTPVTYFEGEYTSKLKYLAELPPGKVMSHFDRIDRKTAKETIGDVMVFWGNVPAQLLITGTPEQVKDDVKELIDTFADNGGLIVDSSMGLPCEARPENVEAMIETVFTYGVNA